MGIRKLLCWALLSLLLTACAHTRDEWADYRQQAPADLFNAAQTALVQGRYASAVKGFEALDVVDPFGPYAQRAQSDIIYAYYRNGDVTPALAAVDRYIRLYPQEPDTAYAYYMKGVLTQLQGYSWLQRKLGVDPAWRDLEDQQKAFMAFYTVATDYPNSVYVPDALLRMRYLRNMMARKSLELSKFYYARRAYVAAANRANFVIQHFDGTAAVPEALAMMVRSYRQLGLSNRVDYSLRLLKENYPESAAYQSVSGDLH